ncbi:MAG: translation initiation factor IF-2 [Candidatus Dojkabacteria bacterium]|jgi:translation initiation factor IF-2
MARSGKKIQQKKKTRTPIVTILGHVDHGKTSILDKIREADVQSSEAGGITQKVSVFTVNIPKTEQEITFVDTPGHEAFDLMRTRGGSIADIVLLVVAANDGVQPQTKESIDIIKESTAKPIVVINKVDLPDIDLEKVKREVTNAGLQLEGFGGNVPVIEVSAKTGKGILELLDLILLVAEVEGLREDIKLPKGVLGKAFVLESVKDEFKGNVSSIVLVQGNICEGNRFGYKVNEKLYIEKIKGLITEEDQKLCTVECGCGGKVIGLSHLLELGTTGFILSTNNIKLLESVIKTKEEEEKEETTEETEMNIEDFFFGSDVEEEGEKLKVIVKSSSEGSLEAIKNTLSQIVEDDYSVDIVDSGVGNITLRDVEFAELSKAIVLGFEVQVEPGVADYAKKKKVLVKTYDVIYRIFEEIEEALAVLSLPEETEEEIGSAKIKAIFTLSDGSKVLGSKVEKGMMKRDCKVYIVRDDEIVGESKIKSLRINKDQVNEVKNGFECGIQLFEEVDAIEGDSIFCYKKV